ncbi:MAG: nucleotidyltransferase family protein [Pseudomonadota bacterium]
MAINALILAGQRQGTGDPLSSFKVAHKGLIEIAGTPMLLRVVQSLDACAELNGIVIAANKDIHETLSRTISTRIENKTVVKFVEASGSPSQTIGNALQQLNSETPLLVTTSDHPLLTREMVHEFLSNIDMKKTDAAAACVERHTYEEAYPNTVRTFIRLKGFEFSGANIFWFKGTAAQPLIEFWRKLEAKRKKPIEMANEIGISVGLRYLLGRLTKPALVKRLYQKTGAKVDLIALTDAEAAIDVDKPADVPLAEAILKRRRSTSEA